MGSALLLLPVAMRAATLSLSSPQDFQVIQRWSTEMGTIAIRGMYADEASRPDSYAVRFARDGKPGGWHRLKARRDGDGFRGEWSVPAGGWRRLEVRALAGGAVLAEASVEHVGVGEVFVVAGQSNSANHGEEKQTVKSGRVSAFDGTRWQIADDPQPGASGSGGSFLPPLGDTLAGRLGVPVGFVACGSGGTSVREWLPKGARFTNPPTVMSHVSKLPDGAWTCDGALYDNFVARMKSVGPTGFRAVLWHQGESDGNQTDATRTLAGPLYREYLGRIVHDSRADIGWNAPWFVAKATYHVPGDESSPEIRAAQESLWKDGIVLEGPDTDALKGVMREAGGKGVHFSGPGLREHAALWVDKVLPWIQRTAK